jgi:hypothetical protein
MVKRTEAMPVYTVHEPPQRDEDTLAHSARFRFVRDGFHFWAMVLAPLWMLRHRLWVELIVYLLMLGGAAFVLRRLGIEESAGFWVALFLAVLVGIEASSLLRWKLSRRGFEWSATISRMPSGASSTPGLVSRSNQRPPRRQHLRRSDPRRRHRRTS